MDKFGVVANVLRTMLRQFILYEFLRSVLVGAAHRVGWRTAGADILFDFGALLLVGALSDDDRRSWPSIVATVIITEAIRFGLSTHNAVGLISR